MLTYIPSPAAQTCQASPGAQRDFSPALWEGASEALLTSPQPPFLGWDPPHAQPQTQLQIFAL